MLNKSYTIENQAKKFAGLWQLFSADIDEGRGRVDLPEGDGLQPSYITTVIRIPKNVAQSLRDEIANIHPHDYHYPVGDIHVTLVNLDQLLNEKSDIDWKLLASHISKQLDGLPTLQFLIKGLNVFPTAVFVEAYDVNSILEEYRDAIIQGVGSYLGMELNSKDYESFAAGVAFANLLRFKQPPKSDITELISRRRNVDFGLFTPSQFEIVSTNKVLSMDGTIIHATVPLNN